MTPLSISLKNGPFSKGRAFVQRSAAKPIIPSTPMTAAIQATKAHDLQSDESHTMSAGTNV